MSSVNKLILSPHPDDEVLGCGGILDSNTFVYECGNEDRDIPNFGLATKALRAQELFNAKEILGFNYCINQKTIIGKYQVTDFIDSFAEVIQLLKPDKIFIPYPSYNQDHQTVYNAAIIALRHHDINFFVKKVLIYEQDHAFLWNYSHSIENNFKPNYFVPIDIEKKIAAYKCMKSQVRSFRSPELLRELARIRGRQGMMEYAEAFQIIRWID